MIDYSYNPKLKGLTKIIHHFKIHHYPAKTCVVNQGDRADTLFFMVKGSATVSIKEDDKNMIISYLNTGDFLVSYHFLIQIEQKLTLFVQQVFIPK